MVMLKVTGGFLIALGVIWLLQGGGWLGWPADSFMLGRREWMGRGLAIAMIGAAILGFVEYRRRS